MKKLKEILKKLEKLLYWVGFITVILWLLDRHMSIYLDMVMVALICLKAYLGKQFFFDRNDFYLKNIELFLDGLAVFVFSKSITAYYLPDNLIPIIVPYITLGIWFILTKNNIADV